RQAALRSRDAGIDLCALDTSCKLNQYEPRERTAQIDELRRWIALAQSTSVPLLRVFGGQGSPNYDDATQDGFVVDALRQIAPEAEAAGISVMLETHDAFSSARRVGRILDTVASPSIGALWDSHHPYRVREDVDVVTAALGTRIVHVHVKDARRAAPDSEEWQLVPLGEGELPVKAQLAALNRMGYRGYVAVEWEKKWHPELAEPEVALPQHLTWLRSMEAPH
ncbi:MAG: Xylose isomerase protein barrel, partial [Chloroflexi bacterium]|nr:Xylose isomerase protein barrel [Chloroflexota bacterium]